jgi:hypothetical protein
MPNDIVSILPKAGNGWAYAWSTKNYDATLGHTKFDASTTPTIALVFGANGKKPNRVIKELAGGKTKSTYVEAGKEDDAKTAGWKVMIGTVKRAPQGKNTKAVAIKLEANVYHCWLMPNTLHTALGTTGLTQLGIVPASTVPAEDRIWGAQGYILKTEAAGVPAGSRFGIRRFSVSYPDASGKKHKTFAAPDSPHMTGA